ncbi:MAG TPA: glycosyltransferase [Armatimonadota bacterium]|nr:glycosyltransferase [Armatimonadota bacterium]
MRVLHAPLEIAGQVGLTIRGQRELGITAHGALQPHPFDYGLEPDFPLYPKDDPRHLSAALAAIRATAGRYDVYHYHTNRSILPKLLGWYGLLDARLNRLLGKTVVAEFWGSEIRLPSVEAARNPYYIPEPGLKEARNRKIMAIWAAITRGHVLIADDAMRAYVEPYFPSIHITRQRIDARALTPRFPDPATRVPVVLHAPSDTAVKGTRFVRETVERLRARGIAFEYRELSGVAHAQVIEILRDADLLIDQLLMGSHGALAVEAMALGTPVICHILPELIPTYPDGFPIIPANPETLENVLEEWLQRPEDRARLGEQAREYAERVHDCRAVARRLLEMYAEIAAA